MGSVAEDGDSPHSEPGGSHSQRETFRLDFPSPELKLFQGFFPLDLSSKRTHLEPQVFAHIGDLEPTPSWTVYCQPHSDGLNVGFTGNNCGQDHHTLFGFENET